MKVTITCRFTFDGIEVNNEADCRLFLVLKQRHGRWGMVFHTLLFDNNKHNDSFCAFLSLASLIGLSPKDRIALRPSI